MMKLRSFLFRHSRPPSSLIVQSYFSNSVILTSLLQGEEVEVRSQRNEGNIPPLNSLCSPQAV